MNLILPAFHLTSCFSFVRVCLALSGIKEINEEAGLADGTTARGFISFNRPGSGEISRALLRFGPLPRCRRTGKKSEAKNRRLSDFPGGPLGLLWPATGPIDGPGALGRGRHKTPWPVNQVAGVRFGGQDFLLRRSCRYASQANSSAPAKAIAPVINRVVFMGCAPGCRGPAPRSRPASGRPPPAGHRLRGRRSPNLLMK